MAMDIAGQWPMAKAMAIVMAMGITVLGAMVMYITGQEAITVAVGTVAD